MTGWGTARSRVKARETLGVCRIWRGSGNSDGVIGRLGLGRNAPPDREAGFVALDEVKTAVGIAHR